MNAEDPTTYIIHHLTQGDSPKDLIFDLCEKFGLNWPQAETLVKQVQEEKRGDIARKQFPLMFTLALGIFLVGLGLIGYSVYVVWTQFPILEASRSGAQTIEQNMDALAYMYFVFQIILQSGGQIITMFILGIGMVIGSLLGMRDTWGAILENIKGL